MRRNEILILTGVAVILALPVLVHGPMLRGHDSSEHLNFAHYFSQQFWSGDLDPRWLIGMNHGLGSATLFVYPCLPYYIVSILDPLGKALHFSAFNVQAFLALLISGAGAFLWASTMAGRKVALTVAVLYMLMPYHLAVDFYRRTALPECWALAWMPFVLYFVTTAMKGKRRAILGIGVFYALLILSHLMSVLIFSAIPLAMAVVFSATGEKFSSLLRISKGMLLGIGLSCFYLLPALFVAKYFPTSRFINAPEYLLRDNLIGAAQLAHLANGRGFVHTISLTVVEMAILIAICSIAMLTNGNRATKRELLFWVVICGFALILMSSLAMPIWETLKPIHNALEFPWRLNILLCLGAVPLLSFFLAGIGSLDRSTMLAAVGLGSLVVMTWMIAYGEVWHYYRVETVAPAAPPVSETDGFFDSWTVPGLDQTKALEASTGPRVKFVQGQGSAEILVWKPRWIELVTSSATGGSVVINQFYYPQWRANIFNTANTISVQPTLPAGLVDLQVPPGVQRVRLEIPVMPAEKAGLWISLFCLLMCLLSLRFEDSSGL